MLETKNIILFLFIVVIVYNIFIKGNHIKYLEQYVDTNIVDVQHAQTHRILQKLLKDIHSLFGKYRLPYFVDRNTLASVKAFGELHPQVNECDISVFYKDKSKLLNIFPWLQIMGYGISEWWGGYRIYPYSGYPIKYLNKVSSTRLEDREWFDYTYPHINIMFVSQPTYGSDLFVYHNKYLRRHYGDFYIAKEDLFPLKLYDFYDTKLYGPNNPDKYLATIYRNKNNVGYYPLVYGNVKKLRDERD